MPRRRRKKKRRTVPIPVASMGDIAFLLIIFFLLLSETNKDRKLKMELPRSGKVKKIKHKVAMRIDIDQDGKIYIDGNPAGSDKEVMSAIEERLKMTISDDQRRVQFRCHAGLPKNKFEPVLQAIAEGGGIIEAVGEKQ